jgi:hypothetical protein
MPEPTSTATATLVITGAALPVLTIAGVSLGLRSDVLLAGFCGAVAAMTLLGSAPGSGDTWRELLKTTLRRVGIAIGSAVTAGYTAPLLLLLNGVPETLLLSVSFLAGAGAMQMLPWLIERFGKGQGVKGGAA